MGASDDLTKCPLHQHYVHPSTEFKADRTKCPNRPESHSGMQGNGCDICTVADHRDHLPPRSGLAARNERSEKSVADTVSGLSFRDVDGILERIAVSRTGMVRRGITVADDSSGSVGDEIWQAVRLDRAPAPEQLLHGWRYLFEARQSVKHMMSIDRVNGRRVRLGGIAD